MNSPLSPKSPKTPRNSVAGTHGGGVRNSKSMMYRKVVHPVQNPSRGGDEQTAVDDMYNAYSNTIAAAEKALQIAKEDGFDPLLRKPRRNRKSTFLQSPKSPKDITNGYVEISPLIFGMPRMEMIRLPSMSIHILLIKRPIHCTADHNSL